MYIFIKKKKIPLPRESHVHDRHLTWKDKLAVKTRRPQSKIHGRSHVPVRRPSGGGDVERRHPTGGDMVVRPGSITIPRSPPPHHLPPSSFTSMIYHT